jgi:hypothetical protein
VRLSLLFLARAAAGLVAVFIASSASTVISCLLGGDQFTNCIIGIILAVIPLAGGITKKLVTDLVKEGVKGVVDALGAIGSSWGIVTSGGDLYLTRPR